MKQAYLGKNIKVKATQIEGLNQTTLFEGSSVTTITLSESVGNFEGITVIFTNADGSRTCSADFYNCNGKTIYLGLAALLKNELYHNHETLSVSGNIITPLFACQVFGHTKAFELRPITPMPIKKVIGFNRK